MASSTITLVDSSAANIVYTLVGSNESAALYKVATRALNLPRSLNVSFKIGVPGAKGNDKLIVAMQNSIVDADGITINGLLKLEVSVPRNAAWTAEKTEDILNELASLLSSSTHQANIAAGVAP